MKLHKPLRISTKTVKPSLLLENKILKRINSLLSRKDIIDLENDKVDTLRLLILHLESNKEMSTANLIKFLKS